MQYWGKLFRQVNEPGIYCFNPEGIKMTRVSLKQESLDLPNIKISDASGTSIVISANVRYRVANISLRRIHSFY